MTDATPAPARRAIRNLERAGPPAAADIDAFLAGHEFPLVEGNSVTFVFRGEVDAVALHHWIYGLPSSQEFRRIDGSDLWYLSLELPPGSRVEYKLEVRTGDDIRLIEDPLNPRRARDPFGANSVCATGGYEDPEWTREDPESRPGTLEPRLIRSNAYGGDVAVTLYLPARYRPTARYPLLLVHDGSDYVNYAGLKTVLDNVIHRHEVAPLIAVLIDSPTRLHEFANHEPHAVFLAEELVPQLQKELPLREGPLWRCLMGASFGAVAAFSTAWRYPDAFGRLLLQSGSFAFSDIGGHARGPVFDPVADFVNAYRDDPVRVAEKVFMSCGMYESLIYENRSLVPVLRDTGMDVRYVETRDGHNWENWRGRLREALSWLFPGPLWMFYE